eukprot:CAMPEP_0179065786 /NCGR_PEP_ID=MMETSP0796-20121207/28642_1 /TAXON_ID=73915 /ORGANISM="Pyrodinium bahamense, Strain pbaha01" /LENGTH=61 /DNA_ID=CAMNT_0020762773 /DNA_START=68 /DNA_END=249 /DNA_ORIENTATION=-
MATTSTSQQLAVHVPNAPTRPSVPGQAEEVAVRTPLPALYESSLVLKDGKGLLEALDLCLP